MKSLVELLTDVGAPEALIKRLIDKYPQSASEVWVVDASVGPHLNHYAPKTYHDWIPPVTPDTEASGIVDIYDKRGRTLVWASCFDPQSGRSGYVRAFLNQQGN